jgi:hypothetical protein
LGGFSGNGPFTAVRDLCNGDKDVEKYCLGYNNV